MRTLKDTLLAKDGEIKQHLTEMIPDYMHGGILRYLWDGIPPGDFLTAVICNNLKEAAACADGTNANLIIDYARFFTWYMPQACWGSEEKFHAWKGWHELLREEESA